MLQQKQPQRMNIDNDEVFGELLTYQTQLIRQFIDEVDEEMAQQVPAVPPRFNQVVRSDIIELNDLIRKMIVKTWQHVNVRYINMSDVVLIYTDISSK